MSSGLLDRIPLDEWQKCVDRITFLDGDVRVAICLHIFGFQKGAEKLSAHRVASRDLRRVVQKHRGSANLEFNSDFEYTR